MLDYDLFNCSPLQALFLFIFLLWGGGVGEGEFTVLH